MSLAFSLQVTGELCVWIGQLTFGHTMQGAISFPDMILLFMHSYVPSRSLFVMIHYKRHNAGGLKEIALEFILRNLNDPMVVTGLSVSLILLQSTPMLLSTSLVISHIAMRLDTLVGPQI